MTLDPSAREAVVAELQDERRRHIVQLVEIERELAQLGAGRRMDAFRSAVAGYEIAIILDERLGECTDRSVREDVAQSFDAAAAWMRKSGELA